MPVFHEPLPSTTFRKLLESFDLSVFLQTFEPDQHNETVRTQPERTKKDGELT